MESLKFKSRLVTVIVTFVFALLTVISTMTPEGLAAYLPAQYAGSAALIIVFAGAILNQYSEEKRVQRAEENTISRLSTVLGTPLDGGVVLNDEYTYPDDSISNNNDDVDDGC